RCSEDATVSPQGAAGPAGDGRGEPGLHQLCQDAAVRPAWPGGSPQEHASAWGRHGWGCSPALALLGSAATWLRLLPPGRTMNRSLRESNSLLRSAPRLGSTTHPLAVSLAPRQEGAGGQGWHPRRRGGQECWGPSSCPRSLGKRKLPAFASEVTSNSPSGVMGQPGRGARAHLHPVPTPHHHPSHHCLSHQGCERQEPALPCPMYRLVLAGDSGTGKSSFLLRLCTNEFRGDISSTLGVDFQIKQLLVDGEQTTLQIWDTAGQER
ncbi:RASEF protein, partial [Psilopogon haemacephalus]|nr:RASEF protein [Psilopogon haemacephalus]